MDLSPGRMKSRLRKLRRDPAGFAADLPWPPVRAAATAALAAATGAAAHWDKADAAAREDWLNREVCLRQDVDGPYRFADLAGAEPQLWPRLIELQTERPMIACAIAADGRLTSAETDAGRAGVLTLSRPAKLRVYALDGQPPPDTVRVRPLSPGDLLERLIAQGLDREAALRQVWPARERRPAEPSAAEYKRWIARNEPSATDAGKIMAWLRSHPDLPSMSVLMPVHDPRPEHLRAAIRSVMRQVHDRWTLCIADDGSRSPAVADILRQAERDPRVRRVRLESSRGVAVATNAALEIAQGDICLFLDHDDELAPHALAVIAWGFAAHPDWHALYTDEDTIDSGGRRSAPLFKPEFDVERLLAQNWVNHAFAVRTEFLRRLGGLSDGVDGAQDHDLVLRVHEAAPGAIGHLPQVLYHWRVYPGGETLSQRRAERSAQARRRVVEAHLARAGHTGEVAVGPRGYLHVRRPRPDPPPSVLAIVPTRDRPGLLRACMAGLLRHTDYPNLRVRIIDNGSLDAAALALLHGLSAERRAEVLRLDRPFNFSALNNAAAGGADAGLLLFLNDDVLVAEPDWLATMAAEAVREDVGAVGAMLHYPDGRIQHAGVVTGLGPQGVAGHEFRGQAGDTPGPQSRLLVQREVNAVTAACMLVSRRKFEQVGGFDESLAIAFNDVDLCLRLREAGYRNLWTPHARLIHAESATRGSDRSAQRAAAFAEEARLMRRRWGQRLLEDPYYNPNLTLEDESFTLAGRSRWAPPWV